MCRTAAGGVGRLVYLGNMGEREEEGRKDIADGDYVIIHLYMHMCMCMYM